MTVEQVDRQMRRAYAPDRLPGLADRNELGQYGLERTRRDAAAIAAECKRAYEDLRRVIAAKQAATPTREDLAAMLAEHEAVVEALRAAVAAMDAETVA